MRIKQQVLSSLESNRGIQLKISLLMECHPVTVERWITSNSRQLLAHDVLTIIEQETGLNRSEIIEDDRPAITHSINK